MQELNIEIIRSQNRKNRKIVGTPHPFLKWAGGKRQLINQIDNYLPNSFNNYIEPFVGGGAIFFYLLPKKAILIDNNSVLINVYRIIKNNVEELIELLKKENIGLSGASSNVSSKKEAKLKDGLKRILTRLDKLILIF